MCPCPRLNSFIGTYIVELDVRDDPKCQDQISDRLFYGGKSLRKVSRCGKSSIKPSVGLFISRTLREGFTLLSEYFVTISP